MRTAKITAIALISAMALLGSLVGGADAAVIVIATQEAGDVIFVGSGSLNVSALTKEVRRRVTLNSGSIGPSSLLIGRSGGGGMESYIGITQEFPSFGTLSEFQLSDSGSGAIFGVSSARADTPARLLIQTGYISGSNLSGMMWFENQTFQRLGIAEGIYTSSWGSGDSFDSYTLVVSNVPEPSMPILLSLGGLVLLCRRSRR